MSLRIRRGTNAQRATTSFELGELVFTTDTKQLYVGNGIDNGGDPIIRLGTGLAWADAQCTTIIATGAALQVSADTNPSLGGDLDANGFNITGAGIISTTTTALNGSVITGSATTPSTVGYTVNSPISIGTNANPNTLFLRSSQTFGVFTGITNGTNNSGLVARILRNTFTSPQALQPGDPIWHQQAMGFDGSIYQTAGFYGLFVDPDATVASGSVPGMFGAATINSTGGTNYLTFNSNGTLATPNFSISGLVYYSPNYITVGTTASYTLSSTKSYNILLVGTTGLTATINMPASPVDGQVCTFTVASNAVTLVVGTGTVVPGFAGSQVSGFVVRYVYRATGTSWYRI